MKRREIEAFALSLPGATLDFPWGDGPVYKVGGKMFATGEAVKPNAQSAVSFKCSDIAFHLLIERDGVIPAPYLQRAQWVRVQAGAMADDEIRDRLRAAHRLIAMKLPKKDRPALD